MDSVLTRASNRIELRVVQSLTTVSEALMSVNTEGQVISVPVRTQLGMPLSIINGDDHSTLHHGKLYMYDAGPVPKAATARQKPTFGLVRYLSGNEVELEAQVQFDIKLYLPTERYVTVWDMGARGLLPRLIALEVLGLQDDARWDVSDGGGMLLVEDFSLSYPVHAYGL